MISVSKAGLNLIYRRAIFANRAVCRGYYNELRYGMYTNLNMSQPSRLLSEKRYSSSSSSTGLSDRKTATTPASKHSNPKDILNLIKLAKPEAKLFGAALGCLVITSGVSMMFPSVIGKIIDSCTNDIHSNTISLFDGVEVTSYTFYIGLGCIFVVGSFANYGRILILRRIGENVIKRLRVSLVSNLLRQKMVFWDMHKSGDLISRIVNDVTIISRSISQNLNDGLRSMISGLVGLTMMFLISSKLTCYMILVIPPLALLALVLGKRLKSVSKLIQQQLGNLTKIIEQQFHSVKTIQSFNKEYREIGLFTHQATELYKLSMEEARISGYFYATTGFIGNSTIILLLIIGVNMIKTGQITLGDLSSFLMYGIYTGSSVFQLSNFYTELMKGVGASERVLSLLGESKVESARELSTNVADSVDLNGEIHFRNLSFKYPSRPEVNIFNDLDLKIAKNSHVCLVGPSGCGKSSIVSLLLRFYDIPKSSKIIINGQDISQISLQQLRTHIGYVQQEPVLIAGTIKQNLLYGLDEESASKISEEHLHHVIEITNCSFVYNLPHKLETLVDSSTNTTLSGGQKQRLAFARAIMNDPDILVLDEATSALDSASEAAIHKIFKERSAQGKTIISIAHRLSTIRMAEECIVFNGKGEVIERGNISMLLNKTDSELNKLLRNNQHI
ncbi:BA75_04447T0 [Komagataella pastoris]|uniref:BA75_04447T0 n=1 Tax=Komagataella pastoris TaxID=4922 RepID=A0A1B2JHS0_PICPA|nr:BA75_04447T0 [Komagataella pastoris]